MCRHFSASRMVLRGAFQLICMLAAVSCAREIFAETATVGLFTPTPSTTTWTQNAAGGFNTSTLSGNETIVTLERPNGDKYLWNSGMFATSVADWSNTGSDNYAIAWGQPNNLARMSLYDDGSSVTKAAIRSAAAFFPYTLGAFSANMDNTTVVSGNVAGVSVTNPSTGVYRVSGLPAPQGARPGLLMPFKQGTATSDTTNPIPNGFALSSRQVSSTEWEVVNYNNDENLEALNNWGWIYIPDNATGVLAGHVAGADGTMTAYTDETAAIGLNPQGANGGWTSTGYYEFLFGDGSTVNPSTHALFIQGDATDINAIDNIWTWTPDGTTSGGANSFGVHSIDLPNYTTQDVSFTFLAVPYSGVVVVPEPGSLALCGTGVAVACGGLVVRRRRRRRAG